jgi:hypothetical protein
METKRKYADPEARRVKDGEKVLTVHLPEAVWRVISAEAMAKGMSKAEVIVAKFANT